MSGKQNSAAAGKQMMKRKITRENTPKAWKDFMTSVRRARVAQGVSSRDVAAKFGTDASTIAYWERADRTIHPHDLVAFLDMLDMEIVIRKKEK